MGLSSRPFCHSPEVIRGEGAVVVVAVQGQEEPGLHPSLQLRPRFRPLAWGKAWQLPEELGEGAFASGVLAGRHG